MHVVAPECDRRCYEGHDEYLWTHLKTCLGNCHLSEVKCRECSQDWIQYTQRNIGPAAGSAENWPPSDPWRVRDSIGHIPSGGLARRSETQQFACIASQYSGAVCIGQTKSLDTIHHFLQTTYLMGIVAPCKQMIYTGKPNC